MAESWPEKVIKHGLEWRITADEVITAFTYMSAVDPIFTPMPEPSDLEIPRIVQERMGDLAQPSEPYNASVMVDKDLLASCGRIIDWNSAQLTKAKDVLDSWTGEAADSFGQYLTEMHGASSNLKSVFADVLTVTQAYDALIKGLQTDFGELIDKYSSALNEAQLDQIEIGLAVLAAIPSVVTGGTAGGVLVSVLTGGASIAQSMVGASNQLEVLRSFALALRYLRETFEAEMRKVQEGYRYIVEDVFLNPQRLPGVNPDAPKLITQKAFDPGDFSLPDSPQFESNKGRVDTSDLVPAPKRKAVDRKLDGV